MTLISKCLPEVRAKIYDNDDVRQKVNIYTTS
jgi:hypothetical protein